jgi:hypothetical protein
MVHKQSYTFSNLSYNRYNLSYCLYNLGYNGITGVTIVISGHGTTCGARKRAERDTNDEIID